MRVVTFRVDDNLFELLNAYAKKHGMTRSEAIRRILEKAVIEDAKNEQINRAKIEKGDVVVRSGKRLSPKDL